MRQAVVIGCGIAGIAAAAAVGPVVDRVVLVERDPLGDGPALRRGVPQGEQLHNLLGRAQIHLEELIPGFLDALRRRGCGDACVSSDTHVRELGIRMPERDLGLRLMSAGRPVIDHCALELVREQPGIEILDRCRALSIRSDSHGVTGVDVLRDGREEAIAADLVIDAAGPAGLLARSLEAASSTAVPVVSHRAGRWYVSIEVEPPAERRGSNRFWLVFPRWPGTRSGLASPTGTGRWCVSLSGLGADPLPRSFAEMTEYASTLEDGCIERLLGQSSACGPPRTFRRLVASWNRFDRHPEPLDGAFAVGDALARLNPLFGQGISVAAWQASHLAAILSGAPDRASATRDHIAAAAATVEAAWSLGQVVTDSLSVRRGGTTYDLTPALARLVADDPGAHRRYVRIWHLLEPAAGLQAEDVVEHLMEALPAAAVAGAAGTSAAGG